MNNFYNTNQTKNKIIPSTLNKEQQEVIKSNFPILNIAGPGSGKTETLAQKIVYMCDNESQLKELLVLTFTNKAAKNILDRVGKKFNKELNPSEFYIGTYHGMFFKLIKENETLFSEYFNFGSGNNANNINKRLKIIEPDEDLEIFTSSFLRTIPENILSQYKKITNKAKDEIFQKLYGEHLKDFFYKFKSFYNYGAPSFSFIIDQATDKMPQEKKDGLNKIFYLYVNFKLDNKLLSFEDILFFYYLFLKNNSNIKEKTKEKFKHLFIDEYQDTNPVQAEILDLIQKNNDYIVGDPDQSIYKFLGADLNNIMKISKRKNINIIQLLNNYRSSSNIVQFTNDLTKTFSERISGLKPCVAANNKVKNNTIKLISNCQQMEQWVIEDIKKKLQSGIPHNEIAVISRNKMGLMFLEPLLKQSKLNYVKYGGGKGIYDYKDISIIFNVLHILMKNYSINNLFEVLSMFTGVGEALLNDFRKQHFDNQELSFKELVEQKFSKNKKLKECSELLFIEDSLNFQNLKKIIEHPNFDLLNKSLKNADTKAKYDDTKTRIEFIMNEIENLFSLNDNKKLEEYLSNISLNGNEGYAKKETEEQKRSKIILTTAHSSKGLEWNTVYILNAIDGEFPSGYSLGNEKAIEEEKRLFYVSISRAKENLILISKDYSWSRFLNTLLNKPYFEKITIEQKDRSNSKWY
jgi:DNA helicase-2/ATP-dependent DNA helicase PcrA